MLKSILNNNSRPKDLKVPRLAVVYKTRTVWVPLGMKTSLFCLFRTANAFVWRRRCYTGRFITTIVNAVLLHKKLIRVTWRLQTIFNATRVAQLSIFSNSYNVVAINWLSCCTYRFFAQHCCVENRPQCNITIKDAVVKVDCRSLKVHNVTKCALDSHTSTLIHRVVWGWGGVQLMEFIL